MSSGRRQPAAIRKTDRIDVTFGAFEVGEYVVPYMTSVLQFGHVYEYLNLVTEDPKYATQNWTIGELFQRDVDQSRVIDIAHNYLDPNNARRPVFFNSITVVLNKKELPQFQPPEPEDVKEFEHNVK